MAGLYGNTGPVLSSSGDGGSGSGEPASVVGEIQLDQKTGLNPVDATTSGDDGDGDGGDGDGGSNREVAVAAAHCSAAFSLGTRKVCTCVCVYVCYVL